MNDNVGEMPLEIFGDYVSDCLSEEWTWEYFVLALNGRTPSYRSPYGNGYTTAGQLGVDLTVYGCSDEYFRLMGAYGNGGLIFTRKVKGEGISRWGDGKGQGSGEGRH